MANPNVGEVGSVAGESLGIAEIPIAVRRDKRQRGFGSADTTTETRTADNERKQWGFGRKRGTRTESDGFDGDTDTDETPVAATKSKPLRLRANALTKAWKGIGHGLEMMLGLGVWEISDSEASMLSDVWTEVINNSNIPKSTGPAIAIVTACGTTLTVFGGRFVQYRQVVLLMRQTGARTVDELNTIMQAQMQRAQAESVYQNGGIPQT